MKKKSYTFSAQDITRFKNKITLLSAYPEKQDVTLYRETVPQKTTIDDEIVRRERLRNIAIEQDIKLKRSTLIALFIFLAAETIVVFGLAFFQGLRSWGFHLEEWSFNILVGATILQITYMLQVAVKHLFPEQKTAS